MQRNHGTNHWPLIFLGVPFLYAACDGTGDVPQRPSVSVTRAIEGETCFVDTGSLVTPHSAHTATPLDDGRVLIAGGSPTPFSDYVRDTTDVAEIYDTATSTFRLTGHLNTARALHTATRLLGGRVLIAGGQQGGTGSFASAELYDPAAGTFAPTGSMSVPRQGHTATLLLDGRVLIIGGYDGSSGALLASAELYDPVTGTFTPTGNMAYRRQLHAATRLFDGLVVVQGGIGGAGPLNSANPLDAVELYDPATGLFKPSEPLPHPAFLSQSTLLNDGSVLLSGGAEQLYAQAGTLSGSWKVTYLFGAEVFRRHKETSTARILHTSTGLDDGTVLLTGGSPEVQAVAATSSAELIDPVTQDAVAVPPMRVRRKAHSATLLASGEVLIVGGHNETGNVLESELYLP